MTPIHSQLLYEDELVSIQSRFPGFRLRSKSSSYLCKIIAAVLYLLTLGRSRFMEDYHTVVGKTLYYGGSWGRLPHFARWRILRHERVHLEQALRVGFGRCFWLGWVLWAISYVFLLPVVFTLRAYWEREAYRETIRCTKEYGFPVDIDAIVAHFVGPQYFWMFPFRKTVKSWFSD